MIIVTHFNLTRLIIVATYADNKIFNIQKININLVNYICTFFLNLILIFFLISILFLNINKLKKYRIYFFK